MIKVNFNLREPAAKKESGLRIVLRYNNNRVYYNIKESINPRFWNSEEQRAKQTKQFPEYPEFNRRLDQVEVDIKSVFRRYLNDNSNSIPSPETLKKLLDKEFSPETQQEIGLFAFFDRFIKYSESGRVNEKTGKPISKNTIRTYNTALSHLKTFQSTTKRRIDFDTIDIDFYSEFTTYLAKTKKLSTNAIAKNIQILKTVLTESVERRINNNLAFKSPRFKTVREESDSIYLTDSELRQLYELDLSEKPRLDKIRDLFLVGCYTGLRYSDFSSLSKENIFIENDKNAYIKITTQKTEKPVVIPVHDVVLKIFHKYNNGLPKAISNQNTNEYLKEIGKKIESLKEPFAKSITKGGVRKIINTPKWQHLTTHTARRSFATNQYKAGVPAITIMAITGHKTEKAFLKYIKATSSEHARLLKMHWDEQKSKDLKAV